MSPLIKAMMPLKLKYGNTKIHKSYDSKAKENEGHTQQRNFEKFMREKNVRECVDRRKMRRKTAPPDTLRERPGDAGGIL